MASYSPLHFVPAEILTNIAVFLACDDPFLPPLDLLTFQSTCRYLKDALNCHYNPTVWAAAFRYRFDSAAVLRRNFRPNGRDYYDQLRQYTETLVAIRSRNVLRVDMEDIMRIVYVMLLDNNGKNRAQLEAVGVDVVVDIFIRTRLWSEAHLHEGWPDDNNANAFALWNMWMLTTPEKLRREIIPLREQIVTLVLPFVLNPYRYHQAEAPPSHFHFPLSVDQGTIVIPHSLPSAHGPYPVYVHPSREVPLPYFGALPSFSPPPITIAAKLLYFARREIIPFNIPHHLPRTRAEAPPSADPRPTQEDFIEINSHRGAEPPPRITWDWDQGCKLVNGSPDKSASNRDDSARWDSDYWRRRLCGNAWQVQPKWRPGKVYVPGSMDGLWQGRLVFPMEEAMRHLVEHASYPQQQNFNEITLHLTHQPIFMRLKEHHAVSTNPHIPFPPTNSQDLQNNDDLSEWSDLSMRNAWFPGVPGSVNFINHYFPPRDSPLYTSPGEPRNALVTVEGHSPAPGSVVHPPYPQEPNAWVYQTFNRRLDEQLRNEAESAGAEYQHHGHENCQMCREREELMKRGMELDDEDHEAISEAYKEDWSVIERLFENVGLGRDQARQESEMDEDEDFEGEEDEDVDIEDSGDQTDDEKEELDYIADPNSQAGGNNARPVRRGTDRAKIEKCDGIRDIIFNGATDRRHALAWNEFTFYGRVRPWDGLIGILRRSDADDEWDATQYWPRQNFIFFYGYLVGGETFVGNWRFAAADPNSPAWESAFVMSRRKDDEGNDND